MKFLSLFEMWGELTGCALWLLAMLLTTAKLLSQGKGAWIPVCFAAFAAWLMWEAWRNREYSQRPWRKAQEWQRQEAIEQIGPFSIALIVAVYCPPIYMIGLFIYWVISK